MHDTAKIAADLRILLGADAVLTEAEDLVKYESGWRYGKGKALLVVRPGPPPISRGSWPTVTPRTSG